MSKAPSEKTQIRTLKRQLKDANAIAAEARMQARIAEGRLTKAQQECAEWKRRFDSLLAAGFKEPATAAYGGFLGS